MRFPRPTLLLDTWFHEVVLAHLKGPAKLVRFADDFVIVAKQGDDADRIMAVLPKRFAKFGLTIHPEKTRLVDFRRPDAWSEKDQGEGATFTFLGYTFYWGTSQKGKRVVKRRTAKPRLKRFLNRVGLVCRRMRHAPIKTQQRRLNSMLAGHYNYYGVTGNFPQLWKVYRGTTRQWFMWLKRRAQRRTLTWETFNQYLMRFPLKTPRIVHSAYVT